MSARPKDTGTKNVYVIRDTCDGDGWLVSEKDEMPDTRNVPKVVRNNTRKTKLRKTRNELG